LAVVLFDTPAPHVARVRFNRPEARNAINHEVRLLVDRYFRQISVDPGIRCAVLTGNADVFAAGADIREQAERDVVDSITAFNSRAIMECPKPVIAAVNGFALGGGCEVVMQCDIILANDKAQFGQPEIKLGLVPGAGGTQRLPRSVGKHHALYLLLTGNFLSAADAYRLGMVSEIVVENCEPRAIEIASQVAGMGPLAAQQIKEVVLAGLDAPLEAALRMERKAYQLMFGTDDVREGFEAFIEKRTAVFRGK
jgi:enoyl-CoA hydratase/carnithine racemase